MSILKHIIHQPFIFFTGLAALLHSTWSLGTLFAGQQPAFAWDSIRFWGWLLPALFIAFSLDVGQIFTSAEIRAGNRSAAKYATFAVFAVATFYLQWLYMAHHMPVLALAAGVRSEWLPFAQLLRDSALWLIPLLLPISTLMYTLSSDPQKEALVVEPPKAVTVNPLPSLPNESKTGEFLPVSNLALLPDDIQGHTVVCPHCGAEIGRYDSRRQATQALNGHLRHCPDYQPFSKNGHKEGESVI